VVDTATRHIYTHGSDAQKAQNMLRVAIRFYAASAGIDADAMSASVTAMLVGEAVQVLNGDPDDMQFNAPGGVA